MSVGAVNKNTGDRIPTAGMPAIDDALDLTSVNPVQNAIITAALANKQDKTDNSLQTTDKTVVGAINEHEGDIDSLKSGLTNLDNEVNGDATVYPFADVITIEDAVPSNLAECSVKVEPVQDLHGYDKPWVGGAGKNKAFTTLTTSSSNGIIFTVNDDGTISVSGAATDTFTSTPFAEVSGVSEGQQYYLTISQSATSTDQSASRYVYMFYNSNTYVSEGNVNETSAVTVPSGVNRIRLAAVYNEGFTPSANAKIYPMIRLATETDRTWEPYTNICPISGHTEVDVHRDVGKNICGELIPNTVLDYDTGIAISNTDYHATDFIFIKKGQTVTIQNCSKGAENWVYNIDKTNKVRIPKTPSDIIRIFTANDDCYIRCSIPNDKVNIFMIELGSTATEYEPYQGKTYTLALGDTIYGGTVDFDSGVMTVTQAIVEYEGDAGENWQKDLVANRHSMSISKPSGSTSDTTGICNQFIYVATGAPEGCFYFGNQNLNFILSEETEVADWKTYLASNPLQVCYELATPTTVQLTPQQIQLLQGTNTLYASTGDISVSVNGVSGSIGAVQTQANATDAALAELAADIAEQLPTAPTTDGAYVLTVTVEDGAATYSWESAT